MANNGLGSKNEWITAVAILVIGVPVALWFVGGSAPPEPTVPHTAVMACQDRVRKDALHPSSVSFSLTGQGTDVTAAGAYRVRLGFTAENSLGVKFRMDSLCTFEPGSATRIATYGSWEKK